jgi:hypothetical protein
MAVGYRKFWRVSPGSVILRYNILRIASAANGCRSIVALGSLSPSVFCSVKVGGMASADGNPDVLCASEKQKRVAEKKCAPITAACP